MQRGPHLECLKEGLKRPKERLRGGRRHVLAVGDHQGVEAGDSVIHDATQHTEVLHACGTELGARGKGWETKVWATHTAGETIGHPLEHAEEWGYPKQ
jgi:hypothetical protein